MNPRRHAIYAADIRRLGGVVSVTPVRDRVDSEPFFQIGHVSRGGDIVWRSSPVFDEDQAYAAARVLADFVGGVVRP